MQNSGECSAFVFIYVFWRKISEDSGHKSFNELRDCSGLGSVVFFFFKSRKKNKTKTVIINNDNISCLH